MARRESFVRRTSSTRCTCRWCSVPTTLWNELQKEAGTTLLRETGGVMMGTPDSELVKGALLSAQLHGLPYEMLTADQVNERFPALRPEPDMTAVWEPRAGVLFPDLCITAHLAQARRHGADLHYEEPMLRWEPDGDGVCVHTAQRRVSRPAANFYSGRMAQRPLSEPAASHRAPGAALVRCTADSLDMFAPDHCPVHLWQFDGRRFFYGFPNFGSGVKVAFHHGGKMTTVDPNAARSRALRTGRHSMRAAALSSCR